MRRPLRSDSARALANLAIDLGDPGRMARARRLHRGGAVSELHVASGRFTTTVFDDEHVACETSVQLSLPLRTTESVPDADAVSSTECTCDEAGGACMHVLASVLTLAEEVEADPTLLIRWTGALPADAAPTSALSDEQRRFLTGTWPPTEGAEPLVDLDVTSLGSAQSLEMEVDGVDAWPVFADALSTLMDEPD